MSQLNVIEHLVAKVFSDPHRIVELKKGDSLLKSGAPNDRLYYVEKGSLSGGEPQSQGAVIYDCLFAQEGDLLGVRSFFSESLNSHATVVADEDCRLRYVTMADLEREHDEPKSELLLPLLSHVLFSRQKAVFQMMKKEQELDRLNILGQFSAGVAHELNNALAVIARGTQWVTQILDQQMRKVSELDYGIYHKGAQDGRSLSSQEVRQRIQGLQERFDLSYADAKRIAQMDLLEHQLERVALEEKQRQKELIDTWEMGATFRDIQLSAQHAASVIESMKNLGGSTNLMAQKVDLAESLESAQVICRNVTKGIALEVQMPDGNLSLMGNKGELVQVWTNLIKNACDAMHQGKPEDMRVIIRCEQKKGRAIISFQDHGPGVSDEVMPKIFLPNFTTKKSGLNFGLGLGLSIVQKIIQGYNGYICTENTEHGARFSIDLPLFVEGS